MNIGDFPTPVGREDYLRMLVQAGAGDLYRQDETGSLLSTSDTLFDDQLTDDIRINRIRFSSVNKLVLNRDGGGSFSSQFEGVDPPLADGIWHVFTEEGTASYSVQDPDELNNAGSGFYRTSVGSPSDTAIMNGISTGDQFILAFTMPVVSNEAPSVAFITASNILNGNEVVTITGTVTDAEDDNGDVVITAETTLGTVSTPVNSGGTWSLDLTAPAVVAVSQTLVVTITATDSGGLSNTVSRVWTVRSNQVPTSLITTAGGQQTPDTTIDLRGTVSPPEVGQAVTASWEIVSGGGTLTNADSVTTATITFPHYAVNIQALQVRLTATDALNATGTDTVDFTLPAASVPDIPDIVLSVLGLSSIRATFSDPISHLPVTQRDLRYQQTGTTTWTEQTNVNLPYTLLDLDAGTSYDAEGQAHSAAGASSWGGVATAVTTANTPPTITIQTGASNVEGSVAVTVTGTVSDVEDDDGSIAVTANTSRGTASAVTNTNGTWTLTLITPSEIASQQSMTLTVTATDSHGAIATAERTWMVRAARPMVRAKRPAVSRSDYRHFLFMNNNTPRYLSTTSWMPGTSWEKSVYSGTARYPVGTSFQSESATLRTEGPVDRAGLVYMFASIFPHRLVSGKWEFYWEEGEAGTPAGYFPPAQYHKYLMYSRRAQCYEVESPIINNLTLTMRRQGESMMTADWIGKTFSPVATPTAAPTPNPVVNANIVNNTQWAIRYMKEAAVRSIDPANLGNLGNMMEVEIMFPNLVEPVFSFGTPELGYGDVAIKQTEPTLKLIMHADTDWVDLYDRTGKFLIEINAGPNFLFRIQAQTNSNANVLQLAGGIQQATMTFTPVAIWAPLATGAWPVSRYGQIEIANTGITTLVVPKKKLI